MGQFGNQPDFISKAEEITASNTINFDNKLNGAAIYVGGAGDLNVIMTGVVRKGQVVNTTITDGGTGYTAATGVATTGGSGTGLTVDTTVAAGVVTAIAVNAAGTDYKPGDSITISGGTTSATFTVDSISNLPTAADAVEFAGITAGTYLPVSVDYVLSTDTTATLLLACY